MNLILCGMMGSGKTAVGEKLAQLIGRRCYDTDSLIEEKCGKISDIFERYGEECFRKLETELVTVLAQKDNLVIATGGGLVLKKENSDLLQKSGKIIFLRATLETLAERLRADTKRPLLQNASGDLYERLTLLMKERTPIYERVAEYIVDVDGKTPEAIAREIITIIEV